MLSILLFHCAQHHDFHEMINDDEQSSLDLSVYVYVTVPQETLPVMEMNHEKVYPPTLEQCTMLFILLFHCTKQHDLSQENQCY